MPVYADSENHVRRDSNREAPAPFQALEALLLTLMSGWVLNMLATGGIIGWSSIIMMGFAGVPLP